MPENGYLNYNTILQLHLYCHRMGKQSEIPHVQALMVLYQNPALNSFCNSKPGEPEDAPDIFDDPPLSSPVSQRENLALTAPDSIPIYPVCPMYYAKTPKVTIWPTNTNTPTPRFCLWDI